jgi:hypothetical protein
MLTSKVAIGSGLFPEMTRGRPFYAKGEAGGITGQQQREKTSLTGGEAGSLTVAAVVRATAAKLANNKPSDRLRQHTKDICMKDCYMSEYA